MAVDTTIGVSKDAKEEAQEAKHANETWDQFIQRCCEEPPEIVEFVESDNDEDIEELKAMLKENTQTTQRIAKQLEGLQR